MRMVSRFPSAAYVAAEVEQASLMVRPGERYQGNEFRISIWTGGHSQAPAWNLFPPSGGEPRPEGFVKENLHASYVHLHFASAPELPARFVAAARAYLQKGGPKKKKDFRKAKQRSRER
jgi:cobyrinic acid a,c-diamide synthase